MQVSVRPSRLISVLAALFVSSAAALADPVPVRVVSVNLCTDQLALMLAAPGQLISVSRLSHDPDSSVLLEAARAIPANGSGAEEVYILQPDLVLAGIYSSQATVQMLRGLGIRVELFRPARSLADVPERIRQMGAVLGREAEAEALVARFETQLATLDDAPSHRPRAALYHVNNYTSGTATLAGDILRIAGFDNITTEAGIGASGTLQLEQLIMLAPDVIIRGYDYPGQARAEDNLTHPALGMVERTVKPVSLVYRDWICGTPQVLEAVRDMRNLRRAMEADQ